MQKFKENRRQKQIENLIYRPINDRECTKDIGEIEKNVIRWGEIINVEVKYVGRYPKAYRHEQNTQHRFSNLEWKMKQIIDLEDIKEGTLKIHIGKITFEATNGRKLEYKIKNIANVEQHMETNIFAISLHNLVYNIDDYDIFITSDPKNYSGRRITSLLNFTRELNKPQSLEFKATNTHEDMFKKIPDKKTTIKKEKLKNEKCNPEKVYESDKHLMNFNVADTFQDLCSTSKNVVTNQNNILNEDETLTNSFSRQVLPKVEHTLIPPPKPTRRKSLFTRPQNFSPLDQPVLSQSLQPFGQNRPIRQQEQQLDQINQLFNQVNGQFSSQNTQFPSLNISFTQINQPKMERPRVSQSSGTSSTNFTFEEDFTANSFPNSNTFLPHSTENPLDLRNEEKLVQGRRSSQPHVFNEQLEGKAFDWLDSLIKDKYATK